MRSFVRLALLLVPMLAPALAHAGEPRPVRLADAPGVVGKIGAKVIAVVDEKFGVDARDVPTTVLDGRSFAALYKRVSGRSPERVVGFERKGIVYVRDHVFSVDRTILTHEVLHALSGTFSSELAARGYEKLVEGVTDHFTHQVWPARARGTAGLPRSAYGSYERFAARLASIVGDDVLAACYFRDGFEALERRVDARLGRGRLDRALRALEAGATEWDGLPAPAATADLRLRRPSL